MEPAATSMLAILPTLAAVSAWAWSARSNRRLHAKLRATQDRSKASVRQQTADAELFRTLFDAAPECIKLHDVDGIVEQINPAGLQLLDADTPTRVVGHSVYTMIAAEYHTAYRDLVAAVFAGESRSMTFELTTLHGRRRWMETHAVPMRADGSTITGLMAITRDIDELRRLTQQLTDQRNRLRTIIESEPECVKLQDRDGVIMEMNPAGLALLAAEQPEQVVGKTVYDFLDADYIAAYRQLTDDVFAGERRSMEFEIMTVPGERRWLETHAAPLLDASGKVCALLAVTRDIDQRKRDEAHLRRQQDELVHVCRLSTLGELASGLAHELNQPLCALSSYAETALSSIDAGDVRDPAAVSGLLRKIVDETGRASHIIDRLRAFVRKQAPRPRANAIRTLIDDVVNLSKAECHRHHVRLEISLADGDLEANVDRVQVEQILLNLLNNAVQALAEVEHERRRVRIVASRDGDRIAIAVRDFAAGIAADKRAQLFSPFFTTKENGIGMGLALSRSIAESFGGQMLYAPASPGSVFTLLLPPVAAPDD